jgi:trehalose 6-phosphate synthase/phosphatase
MAEGQYCRVYFRVRAPTSIGQSVAVGGSANQLGNFDRNRVIHLVTTPDAYPVWYSAEPIIVPRYQLSQYKYCTVEGGNVRSFERLDSVRTLRPDAFDYYVEDVFNPLRLESSAFDSEANLLQEMQKLTTSNNSLDTSMHDSSVHSVGGRDSGRLLITCFHLPLKLTRTDNKEVPFEATWAESLIAKTDNSVSNEKETLWFGTLTIPEPAPTEEELAFLRNLCTEMKCIPVLVDEETKKMAYHGYCKDILWPLFHNVDQIDHIHAAWNVQSIPKQQNKPQTTLVGEDKKSTAIGDGSSSSSSSPPDHVLQWSKMEDTYLKAYITMTAVFDEKLGELLQPHDVVWVHDYHLMLLPGLIRKRNVENIRTCFFLHIPFPTSQIFRSLGSATDLLASMLAADMIGFHAFDHSRHFLNAAKRIMGVMSRTLQGGLIALEVQDREVIVTMSHVSVEPATLDQALDNTEVAVMAQKIKEKYKGKKIILGIDVCQRLSGGALKLAAVDKLSDRL